MRTKPKIHHLANLRKLAARLRDDLNNPTKPTQLVLLYAYNRTGKTRLSMEFKDAGKRKTRRNPQGIADTLYFNAYTEDLFTWENDLDGDAVRLLQVPRRLVWNPTVRIVVRGRARWACGQAAFEPVHMSTGRSWRVML